MFDFNLCVEQGTMTTKIKEILVPEKKNTIYFKALIKVRDLYFLQKTTWIISIRCEYNSQRPSCH
jgi:hypothetical protein